MSTSEPFLAVIADMDGVITQTATLHEKAWQRLFDDFLNSREPHEGEDHSRFTPDDYRKHVDGKPRFDGVRDFLAARGIELEEGGPDDPDDAATVRALGERKNAVFRELLEREGVATFPDTIAAFDRWQRGGLPLAVVSASRNCRPILSKAGVLERFDVVVDGVVAEEDGLDGKPEMIAAAAERLGLTPDRAVLLEDATSGVRAGADVGIGLVAGVDRGSYADDLRSAGADVVVQNVAALRFPRHLPNLAERRAEFETLRGGRDLAVFLDFDGTLSPIVEEPAAATIPDSTRATVAKLAGRATVAVVSGRARADVAERAGVEGIIYAGSHGLEIAGRGRDMVHPAAKEAAPAVERATRELEAAFADIDGAIVERKPYSVAAHYRQVADELHDQVEEAVVRAREAAGGLRERRGKKVIELVPDIDWDKGRAVEWLLDSLDIDASRALVIYIGDDETDEDAFRALAGRGLGIHVGAEIAPSLANYRLADPDAVAAFLAQLADG
jgi:trehalose-phosphatase